MFWNSSLKWNEIPRISSSAEGHGRAAMTPRPRDGYRACQPSTSKHKLRLSCVACALSGLSAMAQDLVCGLLRSSRRKDDGLGIGLQNFQPATNVCAGVWQRGIVDLAMGTDEGAGKLRHQLFAGVIRRPKRCWCFASEGHRAGACSAH